MFKGQCNLISSACTKEGLFSELEILEWYENRKKSYHYAVSETPLNQLKGWNFADKTGDVVHQSGQFFSIRGINFEVQGKEKYSWQQPIIDQPEIGVLGFIAQEIKGVLHVLVQAKMEPGNVNLVQLSPTVQATRSNYTMVHGGKRPAFIEYFFPNKDVKVLYDQLQSEQGTRYLQKRNRNLIVEVSSDESFKHGADFIWMTLGQLQRLMRFDDLVHLDCRSILGGLGYPMSEYSSALESTISNLDNSSFGEEVLNSMLVNLDDGGSTYSEILSWLVHLKFSTQVCHQIIPLISVENWISDGNTVQHVEKKYFSIIGVSVEATSREVTSWTQPLVKSNEGGVIGLLAQERNGVLHFLIQGLIEPGLIDIVELAASVQFTASNYTSSNIDLPHYANFFVDLEPSTEIVFDSVLSEEGGRFYHSRQRHMIIKVSSDISVELEDNYNWLTLRQIQECGRYNNFLNIELRSVLSSVSPLI